MPTCCVFCGVECSPCEDGACAGCAADLPWNDNACPGCAAPQQLPLAAGLQCANCQAEPTPFRTAAAAFRYAFPVDAAIKMLKFRRRLEYVPVLGAILAGMRAGLPADIDLLLPVPLHWRRQALRGFNQADELCRVISRQGRLQVSRDVHRWRATPPQSGLDARARRRNLRGAFRIAGQIDAQHVLIVDDVITTGATCRELAQELRRRGVPRVSVLAVARR